MESLPKKTVKILVYIFLVFGIISPIQAQKKSNPYRNLIIGTYTKPGKSQGIYVYKFNTLTGNFSKKAEADGVDNPSYLTLSANHKFVYAVNETVPGKVSAFTFDSKTGQLGFLDQVNSGGDNPCYISVDAQNRFAFIANYSGGSLSAIPILKNGSLSSDIQTIQHFGKGVDTSRQEKAHVHMTYLSPDQKILLATDLGTDSINVYRIDYSHHSPLSFIASHGIRVEPGMGPRHLAFGPKGKFLYLVQELKAQINVYAYNQGGFQLKQTIGMEKSDFTGKVGAADIHVSADGKFLYASDRGEANDIVIYSILSQGKLKRIGRTSVLGKSPRNFTLDPSGRFLLVANQNSDDIILFKRNKITGLLSPTGKKIEVGSPVCLKFD
jgi:6-phosphogluconolactonase